MKILHGWRAYWMIKDNSIINKMHLNGETVRKSPPPELALSSEVTKWKPTEYMKDLWVRKPYK